MATKKQALDLPCCAQCTAGVFEPGAETGECRLYPMEWLEEEGEIIACHRPASIDGWCRQFERRCNA